MKTQKELSMHCYTTHPNVVRLVGHACSTDFSEDVGVDVVAEQELL
jgi:hypothetical protein